MLSKFSVKKPMTIFVAVVLVLVLGIVAFMKMTPDLLPNMEFPYAVIMTTYTGQTPETVESTVSKPLEKSLAIIDGVKKITSTSSENFSIVMIQFEDGTNMNTATVDMRSSLDTISDAWPDGVGTPYLIKADPNMLPVCMAAVDYKGKSRNEISKYTSDNLIDKLEGIDGIASVSSKGLVTENEQVVISQQKIDALNQKISDALDEQFGKAENKLKSANDQLNNNISKAKIGSDAIGSSMQQIKSQQEQLADKLADAQSKAQTGSAQILGAKMQLLDQKAALTQTKQTLETAYKALLQIKSSYSTLVSQKNELTKKINSLTKFDENYKLLLKNLAVAQKGSEQYLQIEKQLEQIDEQLKPYGFKKEAIAAALNTAKNAVKKVDSSIQKIASTLSKLGTSNNLIDSSLQTITEKISQLNAGISNIDSVISGLDQKTVTVNDALATISKQRSNADFKMSSALITLTSKQAEVQSAVTQLSTAQKKVQNSLDTLSQQKDKAKSKADMNNAVTTDSISGILMAQNFSMPAGYVTDDDSSKYMVRVGDKVKSEKEMKALQLFDSGIDGIGVITLDDVADVFTTDDAKDVYAKINGNPGVVLSFSKQSDASTSIVCKNIDEEFKTLSDSTKGLNFTTLYNQGNYISVVIYNVLQNLLMGAVLAIIILYLFLRDIKPTIIVALSIPISVVFAVVLMYFSGITLNIISLSGLAIGVGMLVDNSVVVIENIYRLRNKGVSPIKSAINGARQVAGAIASSTLTTVCVFLPIVFVEGVTRQLFVDMALTIAYSLFASLVVALTLVPAMSQRMLRRLKPVKHEKFDKALRGYERSLKFVLRHKVCAIIVVVAILAGSVAGALARGFSFMPSMSSTEIEVSVSLDNNTSFDQTVSTAEKMNEKLNKYKQFKTVGVMVGSMTSLMGFSGGGTSSDAGTIMAYCVLKDDYTKSSDSISSQIKKDLSFIKGDVSVGGGSVDSMSSVLGNSGVNITLYCDNLDTLKSTATDIASKLKNVKGIDKVDNGIGSTSPEMKITVDKSKAVMKGLTVAQVYQQVAAAISNEKTSTKLTNNNGSDIDVVVVKDESKKVTSDTLGNINLTYKDKSGNQKTTKLSSVADISKSETMNSISRENQKRYITITGTLKDGYSSTNVTNNAKNVLSNYKLPSGCIMEYTGSEKTTMDAVFQMLQMILLGVILIYLIMAAQFQSLKSPFIIMFTIPLAFTGGFLALIITGFDVSVVSLIGFVMLCGIIVNNGIVLVDYINQLRLDGLKRREAIVEAGKTRMRPILITALTTVLGLSVMALGIGTGSEMMQPIAIVCIGGLVYATFMTLYIIPVIYDTFSKKELYKVDKTELESIDD